MGIQFALPFGFTDESPSAVQSGERDVRDFYPTPIELVRNALELIDHDPIYILDPCAGLGVWGGVARRKWAGAWIVGVDQFFSTPQRDYDRWINQDFRSFMPNDEQYDLIVMNPPFNIALEFIQHARLHLAPKGILLALVKITFLCSQERALNFWPLYRPRSVHTLGKRPSFSGDGKTGVGEEYILVTWGKESADSTQLEIGRMW